MMDKRTQYLIQILDKIGSPLLEATEARNTNPDDVNATAQTVASLLGKVVEASISINKALDLKASDAQDDSLRVALAALAGKIVADQYKLKNKIPEAADLNRMQSALGTVLTFADNFTPSPEHIERLKTLEANGSVVDAHQVNIQYVQALIPVINAVSAFPFGQPEQKLIMDVSDRLVKRTAEMRENLMPSVSGEDEKLVELALLRATAQIYAACHEAETARLTSANDSDARISIDPVWQSFDTRTAMLETVAKNIMPAGLMASSSATPAPTPTTPPPPVAESPAAQTPATEPPAQQAAASPPTVAPPPEQPAAAPPTPPPPAQPVTTPPADTDTGSGGNPMSFFSKPGDEETPPPAAPTAAPPPEQPAAAPPTPPPPAQPVATPPTDTDTGSGGNPMSFFSKPGDEETPPPAAPTAAPPPEQPAAAPPTPPEQPAAAPPASDDGGQDDQSSEGDEDDGGNPMAFFAKKD